MPKKILLNTTENIDAINSFFYGKFVAIIWRGIARLSAINPTFGAVVTDLYFMFFSFLVRRYGASGPRRSYYGWPCATKFVNNHPKTNVYSIITNKGNYERQENVMHMPAFFRHHIGEWNSFIEIKQKQKFEKKRYFCAFIVSNMHAPSYINQLRLFFCHQLTKYKKLDCYGAAFHNKDVPRRLYEKHRVKSEDLPEFDQADIATRSPNNTYHAEIGKIDRWKLNAELFRDYKFVICFENSVAPGYITEKLPNVMMGNSIAIYHGAPDVGDYFNPASFINYSDYPDYKAVIRKIIELDQDDAAYARMLRTPFFIDNQVPQTILDKEVELNRFMDRVFAPVETVETQGGLAEQ